MNNKILSWQIDYRFHLNIFSLCLYVCGGMGVCLFLFLFLGVLFFVLVLFKKYSYLINFKKNSGRIFFFRNLYSLELLFELQIAF